MKHYWLYTKYVLKHKWFVFIYCWEFGIPIRGLLHDLSKFRPKSFITYARYFYGEDSANNKALKEQINYQWLYHLHLNKHHWQYWTLREDTGRTKCLEMPSSYMKEMVADWLSVDRVKNGKAPRKEMAKRTIKWYENHKKSIKLHKKTKVWVEWFLSLKAEQKRQLSPEDVIILLDEK